MAIPQDWMPPEMPDEQKDEIAAKHPDDPFAAAAEAWVVWANEMPIEEQGVKSVSTGAQSITYENGGPYDAAMERARWYLSRSKNTQAIDVGGNYRYGYLRRNLHGASEAGEGDPPLPNGEPWGAWNITSADVILTHGSAPLRAGVLRDRDLNTQEDANWTLAEAIEAKADADHTHEGGSSGGGGPHTHEDLAKQTDLDAEAAARQAGDDGKADKNHAHDYSNISNDISAVSDRVDVLEADPTTKTYVDEADAGGLQDAKDYADAAMRVHLDGHGSGSGGGQGYDDTAVKADIAANTAAIAGKSDDAHDHDGYQPAGDYAPTSHDHDGYAETEHAHDYQPKGDYAATGHGHDYAATGHTHQDLVPVPAKEYRLETDANLRGGPSIQLVDNEQNFSDVSFTAGEGLEISTQPSGLTVGMTDEHLSEIRQIDQNRQDIQLLWAATQDKMEIETIVEGQWSFIGENKTSPRNGQFSMDDWYFNKVTTLYIGETLGRGTWSGVRVNDEIHIVDASTAPDGETIPEADRYQGKYIVKTVHDNSGSLLVCMVELVHAVGTIRENKQATIRVRGARVPDHTSRIEDQQKQLDDLIEKISSYHKVVTWKYRGYGVAGASLKQGEFSLWKESTNLIIRMHRYDSTGEYWCWNATKTHPLGDPIVITDPSNGGVVYIADGTEVKSMMGDSPNFYCEVKGTGSTEVGRVNSNQQYIIHIPGLSPHFVNIGALT